MTKKLEPHQRKQTSGPRLSVPKLAQTKADSAALIPCTFHQFFMVWVPLQTSPKWTEVPDLHIDVLDFLSDYKYWENNTGLLQIFRGAGKSTIVGLFITWMLSQDPTLRFLVLSADKDLAVKITGDIKNIINRHPLAKHLHGKEKVWKADTLVVNGSTDGRNPSVTAWGINSNITGGRADWIIYDDTEVPNSTRTATERQNLRTKLDEPTHILVPGGYELFVGTPHSHESIYTELAGEAATETPFRTGCSQIKIPIMTDVQGEFPHMTGTPKWPTRFHLQEIAKRQRNSGTKGHFLSQYLLLPFNPEDTILDPTLIAAYTAEIDVHQANGEKLARLNGSRVMGFSAVWDPSLAEKKSDDSVLAIVFTTDDGHYYIHRTVKLMGDPDEQSRRIIKVMNECQVSHLVIEKNGPGGFLPAIFRKEAAGTGITCEGKHTSERKATKILEAYETRLMSGYLHAHTSVMDSPFRTQLRDFSLKGRSNGKDDYIDAVAMAILNQPIRIKNVHAGTRIHDWQQLSQAGSFEAPMDALQF